MTTSGDQGTVFERLLRCLNLSELEETVLGVMGTACPRLSAVVSLSGSAPEPSKVYVPGQGTRTWHSGDPLPPMLALPVQDEGEVVGWVSYIYDESLSASEAEKVHQALENVAKAAAIPTRNAQRHQQALELALRDPLSGLYNRRAFDEFLSREAQRIERTDRSLALILLDLDDFKQINDRLGHPAGDAAIRQVALILETYARRTDVTARFGGDEFAILLPETDMVEAAQVAKRVRKALACKVPASLGVSDLSASGGQLETMVALADQAMYKAKGRGGNRVCRARTRVESLPCKHKNRGASPSPRRAKSKK